MTQKMQNAKNEIDFEKKKMLPLEKGGAKVCYICGKRILKKLKLSES